MKKFSYVSKKLLKDMGAGGGGDPTLPERVTELETDVERLEGYEETVVESIVINVSEEITNLKEAMLSVANWFDVNPPKEWDRVTIKATAASGTGADFLDGTYNYFSNNGLGYFATDPHPLNYQTLRVSTVSSGTVTKSIKTLKADTTTGVISYASQTETVTDQPLERLTLTFTKGDLK